MRHLCCQFEFIGVQVQQILFLSNLYFFLWIKCKFAQFCFYEMIIKAFFSILLTCLISMLSDHCLYCNSEYVFYRSCCRGGSGERGLSCEEVIVCVSFVLLNAVLCCGYRMCETLFPVHHCLFPLHTRTHIEWSCPHNSAFSAPWGLGSLCWGGEGKERH